MLKKFYRRNTNFGSQTNNKCGIVKLCMPFFEA